MQEAPEQRNAENRHAHDESVVDIPVVRERGGGFTEVGKVGGNQKGVKHHGGVDNASESAFHQVLKASRGSWRPQLHHRKEESDQAEGGPDYAGRNGKAKYNSWRGAPKKGVRVTSEVHSQVAASLLVQIRAKGICEGVDLELAAKCPDQEKGRRSEGEHKVHDAKAPPDPHEIRRQHLTKIPMWIAVRLTGDVASLRGVEARESRALHAAEESDCDGFRKVIALILLLHAPPSS